MGFFSNLFTGERDISRAELQQIVSQGYAPYSTKFLGSKLPVTYSKKFADNQGACLNFMCGTPQKIQINPKAPAVMLRTALEHESVHYDQALCEPAYNDTRLVKPQDDYKRLRIKEIEAYGRELYKFTRDHAEGKITIAEREEYLPLMRGFLPEFLEAYTKKQIARSDDAVYDALDILKSKPVKSEKEVLGQFYLKISEAEEVMTLFSQQALSNLERILPPIEEGTEQSKEWNGRKFFAQGFSFDDARSILNRDGTNYLSVLNTKQYELFWRNICSLGKTQRQQVEDYKSRANKLSLQD